MKDLLFILLDAAGTGADGQGGSAWSGMIMIVAMIVIFYFFMIRPQSKKQKELKKAREAMKKGDKVVTAGGIHGRIKELKDTYIMMEIAPGISIKIDKTSVFADPSVEVKPEADKQPAKKVQDAGAELEQAAGKTAKE